MTRILTNLFHAECLTQLHIASLFMMDIAICDGYIV